MDVINSTCCQYEHLDARIQPAQPNIANDLLEFLPWKNRNVPRLPDHFARMPLLFPIFLANYGQVFEGTKRHLARERLTFFNW